MKAKTFEQALQQLEEIVRELEAGELALEDAIRKFETGMQLSAFCAQKLDETEKKVTQLLRDADGRVHEAPYPDTSEESNHV